jgi:hypothetical protein
VFLQQTRRTNRTSFEIAAAVGTDTAKFFANAVAAKGALKRTYHRLGSIRRQIPVTLLAVGPQVQHDLCVATNQRVAEYPESSGFNAIHILGRIGPGQYDVARAIQLVRGLVQAQS